MPPRSRVFTESELTQFRRWLTRWAAKDGRPHYIISKDLGVAGDQLSKWTSGRGNPSASSLDKMSESLGFDVVAMIKGGDEAPQTDLLGDPMATPQRQPKKPGPTGADIQLTIADALSGEATLKLNVDLPLDVAMNIMTSVREHLATKETHDGKER